MHWLIQRSFINKKRSRRHHACVINTAYQFVRLSRARMATAGGFVWRMNNDPRPSASTRAPPNQLRWKSLASMTAMEEVTTPRTEVNWKSDGGAGGGPK
ncbi:unnamed protein product [Chrysodeixis includens]|uniref:Uncharacterized protein n=1 Tax=Chrysodeixis includens TaxID=689277 RepID=A0A9P0FVC6_CHRIL|nr:unnamed protein product [Chrysodeixis includens]